MDLISNIVAGKNVDPSGRGIEDRAEAPKLDFGQDSEIEA